MFFLNQQTHCCILFVCKVKWVKSVKKLNSLELNMRTSDLWCAAEVAHHFPDVLNHRHTVLPAVVPKLRGRKLPPENEGRP